jgi:hypothetical protein
VRSIKDLVVLPLVCLLMVACTINIGGDSKDQNNPVQPTKSANLPGSKGLDINILKATTEPATDMRSKSGGIITQADLKVQITNSSDETIEFDEVRAIFIEGDNFVAGERCAHEAYEPDSISICVGWFNPDRVTEFFKATRTTSLGPNKATDFRVLSGTEFDLNSSPEKSVVITVFSKGEPLVSYKFTFPGGKPKSEV